MKSSDHNQPLVSVIIPTYNYGEFLGEAVHSVQAQSYATREIIIVDDGSTDDTQGIVRTFGDDVRYVRQANAGPSVARNNGIEHARGDFVGFLDADDLWLPEKLAKQMALFDQLGASVGLIGTGTYDKFDGAGERIEEKLLPQRKNVTVDKTALLMRNHIACSSALVRRSCLEHVGGFDNTLRYCEDWDLWLRISRHYDVAVVDEPLVHRKQHHASASKHLEQMIEKHMLVFDRNVAEHVDGPKAKRLRRMTHSYILYSSGSECMGTDDSTERRLLVRSLAKYPWPSFYPKRYAALVRTVMGTHRWRRLRRLIRGDAH